VLFKIETIINITNFNNFFERVRAGMGLEMGSCYVAQTALELVILLPQPPKSWDYRHAPPHPAQNSST
jgi:hypothetical protein